MTNLRFVGLDVHGETIAVAVAESDGEVRSLGEIPNRAESLRQLVIRLGPAERLRCCYEAGPTGYVTYWQLVALGAPCVVIAPSLVPRKPGDRVKTDRRDAEKLARSHRAGDLTPIWVPDAAHEALRDLVRAREATKQDELRARHRLKKFLLRQGRRAPAAVKPWSGAYRLWLQQQHFAFPAHEATHLDYLQEVEHQTHRLVGLERAITTAVDAAPVQTRAVIAALQAMRGIAQLTAATIVSEVGTLSRFPSARQFMGYSGTVPREATTGPRIRRGSITKTGNAHLRRVITEAAWAYVHPPRVGPLLRKRQEGLESAVIDIARKAQLRLCARYRRLTARGKPGPQVILAVGRELLGFIWAIGRHVEQQTPTA